MIRPFESLGEFMLFRCKVCKAIIDYAEEVSKGTWPVTRPDATGPLHSDFISIHLKCPRCL